MTSTDNQPGPTASRAVPVTRAFTILSTAGLIALSACSRPTLLRSTSALPPSRPLPALVQAGPGQLAAATHPHEARQQRILQWQDENGRIPRNALTRALEQRRANIAASSPGPDIDARGDRIVGTQNDLWIHRGPDNIGGRTRALVIDPRNTDRIFAGGVSGGLWLSSDAGRTWEIVNDWWPSLAVGCIAMDPQNPDVMYVGTGEGFFNGDSVDGAGIFKSVDGGQTFVQLPETVDWGNVCRIAVSHQNSLNLLAGTRGGGIYVSFSGGNSWSLRQSAQGGFDVNFDPTDETLAVGSIIEYDYNINNWVHTAVYSTDRGVNWHPAQGLTRLVGFGSRIEVAYAPSQPSIVYASVATDGGKIWKSIDGGQSYTLQTVSGASGANWYANPLWIDPTNPQVLATGGVHCFRSTDGGATLTQISSGYINTEQAHPDIHQYFEDPDFDGNTNKRVWVVTDGGPYVTQDIYTVSRNSGWQRREQTYRSTQFYGAVGDGPTGKILGGLQDNGCLRLDFGNESAHLMFGGDGGFSAIDPTDTNYMYGEYIFLQIHRSLNSGQTSNYIYGGLEDAGNDANFIAPFILDPNDPNRMLAGGRSLWRSNTVKSGVIGWHRITNPNADRVSAIAVAPGNSDVAWYGLNNGFVFRSDDATAQNPRWTIIDNNAYLNPLPNRYITRILIDPDDHQTVYASFGGFSPDNLYRTTDGGTNWTDITGEYPTGLPDAPVRGIARHPDDANHLFVGTEVGVFQTTDGGVTWSTNDAGPASVSVDEVNFMHNSNTIVLATYGRGIYTRDLDAERYALTIDGTCPGDLTISWTRATPRAQQAIVYGPRQGNATIPEGNPCAGTVLGLGGGRRIRIVEPPGFFSTGPNGQGSVSGHASSGACGGYLQLVEGGSCNTSNTAQIP